jgi:hypothetical protein
VEKAKQPEQNDISTVRTTVEQNFYKTTRKTMQKWKRKLFFPFSKKKTFFSRNFLVSINIKKRKLYLPRHHFDHHPSFFRPFKAMQRPAEAETEMFWTKRKTHCEKRLYAGKALLIREPIKSICKETVRIISYTSIESSDTQTKMLNATNVVGRRVGGRNF